MVMKLYGTWISPFLNIAAFTLNEKNADYELVAVDFPSLKTEEYRATKNPFGQMPAFEDDDLVLFESRAIARYVVAKCEGQGTPLMGSTLKEQAIVNVWSEVEAHQFFPAIWAACREMYRKKVPDAGVIQTNLEKLGTVLDVYEDRLSKHKYLAGDFFSLADLSHIPVIHFFFAFADPGQRAVITSRPHVHAWYENGAARPAWQKIVQKPEVSDFSHIEKAKE